MLEKVDAAVGSIYRARTWPADRRDRRGLVMAHAESIGLGTVYERMVQQATIYEKRLSAYLTGSAFLAAVGGFSWSSGAGEGIQAQFSTFGGILGAVAFLCALRGTTRRVEAGLLTHELEARHVEVGLVGLTGKEAWAWVASRVLFVAVVFLGLATLLNRF